ncbi:aldehyde dehydrogenase family protein [Nocardia takedensis]
MTRTSVETTPMRIGGSPRLASDGATIEAINPATGEVLRRFPDATAEDVDTAVAAASNAFAAWRESTPAERSAVLFTIAEVVERNAPELSMLDVLDNGSPIREMRNDAGATAALLRYYGGLVLQRRGHTVPGGFDRLDYTLPQPYGVVARIVAFNHPLMFVAGRMGAPLAAGNTVIMKPSEHTSLSALRLAELLDEVLPPGLVQIVTGRGGTAGDALVSHPDIRRLSFIGSADTGRHILRRANEDRLKNVTLELGGKNPLVIFPDADLDAAVAAAQNGMNFTWQGQSCGSTSRLLVHEDIYDGFVERLAHNVEQLRSGSPVDEATQTGAIVNRQQFDKVNNYIRIGIGEGARVVAGGQALGDGEFARGFFVRPTVFADVRPDSRLAQEEIFGPVLAAMRFRDYDEAIRIANGIRYGLTASVFTRDLGIAHRFARDVEAGYVWVNEVARHLPGTPFGGTKDSGLGREEDLGELLSYTETKNVHVNFA